MERLRGFLILLLLLAGPAFGACDDDDDDGLDVALVLSGGGALATTHIGAIELIESLGIPIHCVVGTSMGSVVGALYAYGYDAGELQAIFLAETVDPFGKEMIFDIISDHLFDLVF